MQEARVVTIDEEFEELQKGRGPDKKSRKRKGSSAQQKAKSSGRFNRLCGVTVERPIWPLRSIKLELDKKRKK